MGNFIKDKKRGEIGERIVFQILKSEYPNLEIIKAEGKQPGWDFTVLKHNEGSISDEFTYFEVKYDEMAKDTGNICFEVSNGKKLTGIFASQSDYVFYIVPTSKDKTYEVFKMKISLLVDWLKNNESLTRAVNGGDKNKFSLLLVKKEVLLKSVSSFGKHIIWTEKE